ncbi:MAG TPA: nitroreductase family deazaflavin-dependent oxidoreductase [Candidatus Limnocylindrales bacterium]|nr:nitroreductase family deazaflavin-dependent oxidoreductase [Candidatus Limnocylindrales bacterium]
MDDAIRRALAQGQLIDITTTGRRTGEPRRIEIVYHNLDGRIYISGMPAPGRTRAWLRNLQADPRLTIHLRPPHAADLPATARVITDPAERRPALERIARIWRRTDVDVMVEHSPLIEVSVEGYSADLAA